MILGHLSGPFFREGMHALTHVCFVSCSCIALYCVQRGAISRLLTKINEAEAMMHQVCVCVCVCACVRACVCACGVQYPTCGMMPCVVRVCVCSPLSVEEAL